MFPLTRACTLVSVCLAAATLADVEEIFSRHVRIFRPRGEFAAQLIRLAPASGTNWKSVSGEKLGFQLHVPAEAEVDQVEAQGRILQVALASAAVAPRPILQIHRFVPETGHPTSIDRDYAQEYAEQYGASAFKGKFTLTDSGHVVRDRKISFAMVGGSYLQGASRAYRIQWAYLNESTQLFATFDCAEQEWPKYSEQVARMLLSLTIDRPKKK